MIAATWISQTACAVDVGVGGIPTRIVFVLDALESGPRVDELSDSEAADVVVLCGAVLPAFLQASRRIITSEPCAQLLALRGIELIERCQPQERVPVTQNLILMPYRSGGQVGACDWLLKLDGANILVFCGAKGHDALAPPPAKFVIFGREPVSPSLNVFKLSNTSQACIVPIPDSIALSLLPFLKDAPKAVFDAMPMWCHMCRAVYERHEQTWGKGPTIAKSILTPQGPLVFALDSEVGLLLKVSPESSVVEGIAQLYDAVVIWNSVEALHCIESVTSKQKSQVLVGPRWPSPMGRSTRMEIGETIIMEGNRVFDLVVEALAKELSVDLSRLDMSLVPFSIKGLKVLVENGRLECTLNGLENLRVEGVDRELVANCAKALHVIESVQLTRPRISERIIEVKFKSRASENANPPAAASPVIAESISDCKNISLNKDNKTVNTDAVDDNSAKRAKVQDDLDENAQKLRSFIVAKGGKRLLSDLAKEKDMGDKFQILEIARRHSTIFEVVVDEGKRSISLK